MVYDYNDLDLDRLTEVLTSRGISKRQFEVMFWGPGTKRTIKELQKTTSVPTLVKVCATIGCSAEELLLSSSSWKTLVQNGGRSTAFEPVTDSQILIGMQKLLDDKNVRLQQLQKTNDKLLALIESGMISGQEKTEKTSE